MPTSVIASDVFMDTLVTIEVVHDGDERGAAALAGPAFGWFREVEAICSRFEATSELSRLNNSHAESVKVSPILFQALKFALAVAEATDGVFDPTVGRALELAGFNRNYRSGDVTSPHESATDQASYRDVRLDDECQTVTLLRPLVLDLGAVAKGFAIDLAGNELNRAPGFAIDAGGDVLLYGDSPEGTSWHIGIRHPRSLEDTIETLSVTDMAVCTSGDYERARPDGRSGGHILTQRGTTGPTIISTTVVAPTAMSADAFSTAAYALGPERGIDFLERQGVEGLMVSDELQTWETSGFGRFRA